MIPGIEFAKEEIVCDLREYWETAFPVERVDNISEWARQHVKFPKSELSRDFDPDLTPWLIEPMNGFDLPERRRTTFIKPVQGGGSRVGKILICFIISTTDDGDIQYNWPSGEKADEMWKVEDERIWLACDSMMQKVPERGRHTGKWGIGMIQFPRRTFVQQGVNSPRNVASLSVKYQINEEIHIERDGWTDGRLEQAIARTTAIWNHRIFNISNAGKKHGELHQAYLDGFQKEWEVKCPGCKQFHVMRTRWEDKRPELGGLRYDSEGCRRDDGSYDYNRLAPTIRYQMPCGFEVKEGDISTRKKLNKFGRYSEPRNPGAAIHLASYRLEAVSIDHISWIDLIMQKHKALKTRRYGDSGPWLRYLKERECIFADEDEFPALRALELSDRTKDREGIKDRDIRFAAADYQHGQMSKNELPHYWACIVDLKKLDNGRLHVLIVFEGKIDTDGELVDLFHRHQVMPRHVCIDSGHNASHIYQLCLNHGYHAIKGERREFFGHVVKTPDGEYEKTQRIFSEVQPLHRMIGQPKSRGNIRDEPRFWRYSKFGIADRYAWLSSGGNGLIDFEVPSDVSDDFLAHHNSWEVQELKVGKETRRIWVQLHKRDHLLIVMRYISMLIEMAGYIGLEAEG